MFEVTIKIEIVNKSKLILEKINLGRRGIADGNYDEQMVGLFGQLTIYDLLKIDYPKFEQDKFDGGFDVIINQLKIDIKTMGRSVDIKDHYVHNFIGLQKNYQNDLYIFCSYNKIRKVIQVCGWINKDEFFKKCSFFKKGEKRYRDDGSYFITKADLYEIKNSDLISLNNLDELKNVGKKN